MRKSKTFKTLILMSFLLNIIVERTSTIIDLVLGNYKLTATKWSKIKYRDLLDEIIYRIQEGSVLNMTL